MIAATSHSDELRLAWDFVEHTRVSVFLTGKAGTGKTTFLHRLREHSAKSMIVVAPSGVAAINAGGVTIHSFFQLPLSPYVPGVENRERFNFAKDKLRILRSLDLLVIDEISMVRSDTLDAVDSALRRYRRSSEPFGGVQLLMIGDLRQLSPIVTANDAELLRDHYATPYFFGSHALSQVKYVTVQLSHVYRQQDDRFVRLLNNVRENRLTPDDMSLLTSRLNPAFHPPVESGYIRLTTHNHQADSYNDRKLGKLPDPAFTYSAKVEGTFPESIYPTYAELTLKKGAQVMFIKNDTSEEHRYFNGKIGRVTRVDGYKVSVRCPGDDTDIDIVPQRWENTVYTVNEQTNEIESKVQGAFSQLPLRLAWAITIHKSQGLTFDRAIIDAGASFAPGQVYVALSRCRTIEGMVLATPISPATVMSDSSVSDYISGQERIVAESKAKLPQLKRDFDLGMLRSLFMFRSISDTYMRLVRVIGETFARMFAELYELHSSALCEFRERVIDVSDKWLRQLDTVTHEQLADMALQTRIRNGARYFADALTDIFDGWVERSATIKSENKQASRRVQELYGEFIVQLRSCITLFRLVEQTGFEPKLYLQQRRQSILRATSQTSMTSVRVKSKREKKKKEPKVSTRKVSLDMFNAGRTVTDIARERGLQPTTVYSHLASYVMSGELGIERAVSADKITKIKSAISRAGDGAGLKEVKDLLPPGVEYGEIRLVVASMTKNRE